MNNEGEEKNLTSQCKCEKLLYFYKSGNLNQHNHRFYFTLVQLAEIKKSVNIKYWQQ